MNFIGLTCAWNCSMPNCLGHTKPNMFVTFNFQVLWIKMNFWNVLTFLMRYVTQHEIFCLINWPSCLE